jgi:hypothetical protein
VNESSDLANLRKVVAKQQSLGRRLIWLSVVPLVITAAIVLLYSILNARLSGLETPYIRLQFATPPLARPLVLNVERSLPRFDDLVRFPESVRFTQYDCGQAALDAGGIDSFKEKRPDDYQQFQNDLAFRQQWIPYVNYIVNAGNKGYSAEILKGQVRSLAERFLRLVSDPDRFSDNYKAILLERDRQVAVFKGMGVDDALTPQEEKRQLEDPDPHWCDPPPDKVINEGDVK